MLISINLWWFRQHARGWIGKNDDETKIDDDDMNTEDNMNIEDFNDDDSDNNNNWVDLHNTLPYLQAEQYYHQSTLPLPQPAMIIN